MRGKEREGRREPERRACTSPVLGNTGRDQSAHDRALKSSRAVGAKRSQKPQTSRERPGSGRVLAFLHCASTVRIGKIVLKPTSQTFNERATYARRIEVVAVAKPSDTIGQEECGQIERSRRHPELYDALAFALCHLSLSRGP